MANQNGPDTAKAKRGETEPVTVERLRELFRLEPETGRLFWRKRSEGDADDLRAVRIFNTLRAGKEALTAKGSNGALGGMVDGKPVKAARVVWALSFGHWPKGAITWRNDDKSDNRPGNLLLLGVGKVPRSTRSDSRLGVKGVSRTRTGKYRARMGAEGGQYVGTFATLDEAAQALVEAAKQCREGGKKLGDSDNSETCGPPEASPCAGRIRYPRSTGKRVPRRPISVPCGAI
jgi:hypothetical protein